MYLGAQLAFPLGIPAAIFIAPAPYQVPGTNGGMPADYPSAATTPIVVDIPGSPSSLTITAILLGRGQEVVYSSGVFAANYLARSTVGAAPGAEGNAAQRFTILRSVPGAVAPAPVNWPGAGTATQSSLQILVQRVDSGVATSAIASWQLPSASSQAFAPAPSTFPVAISVATEALGRIVSQFRSQH